MLTARGARLALSLSLPSLSRPPSSRENTAIYRLLDRDRLLCSTSGWRLARGGRRRELCLCGRTGWDLYPKAREEKRREKGEVKEVKVEGRRSCLGSNIPELQKPERSAGATVIERDTSFKREKLKLAI